MTNQGDVFQRSVDYWLKRAEKLRSQGQLRRAAVLGRHAARMEPYSAVAGERYALTLHQLHCYEASNREAFRSLLSNPRDRRLYGLIGLNLLALGRRREAWDALMRFRPDDGYAQAEWTLDALEAEDRLDGAATYTRPSRFATLLDIAMNRIRRGDFEAAGRALTRSERLVPAGKSLRRELAWVAWLKAQGETAEALSRLQAAARGAKGHSQLLAMAAALFDELGRPKEALIQLLRAAQRAATPADEATVCMVCDQLGKPEVAYSMLRRSQRRQPGSYTVCYNLAIALLKLGWLEEAVGYMHLCREIDPDDIPGEVVFNRMRAMEDGGPEQVKKEARGFSYCGMCTMEDIQRIVEPLFEAMGDSPQALGRAIAEDENLYRRFLFFLTLETDWAAGLLDAASRSMPEDRRERLLREVLVMQPEARMVKRAAVALMSEMGIKPPYLIWEKERLLMIDPTRQGDGASTVAQRVTARKIRKAAELAKSRELIPWAIQLIHNLDAYGRDHIVHDRQNVWPVALAMYFTRRQGLAAIPLNGSFFMDEKRMDRFAEALAMVETEDELHEYR